MIRFIAKRILLLVPTLFVVVTLSFFITRLAPGNPFASDKPLPPEILANLNHKYGLDKPIIVQYLNYLSRVIRGDLGPSTKYVNSTVNELIGGGYPVSLLLGVIALFLSLASGCLVGIVSALRKNSWVDYLSSSIAILGISLPVFVIGPVMMLIFAMILHVLPTSGWLDENPLTIILPALTLSMPYFAVLARLMRTSMIEVMRSDYIRTARAKGLSQKTVVLRHALKGALLPIVSYMGPAFTNIISGSIVVEQIFRIPGLGRPFVQSALNRDYFLIMGCVIIYSVTLILMNMVVDIVYSLIDPRISYS